MLSEPLLLYLLGSRLFLISLPVELHMKGETLEKQRWWPTFFTGLTCWAFIMKPTCMNACQTQPGSLSQVAVPVLWKLPLFCSPEPLKQIKAVTKSREAPRHVETHQRHPHPPPSPLHAPTSPPTPPHSGFPHKKDKQSSSRGLPPVGRLHSLAVCCESSGCFVFHFTLY